MCRLSDKGQRLLAAERADIGETPESVFESALDTPNEPPIKKARMPLFLALSVGLAGVRRDRRSWYNGLSHRSDPSSFDGHISSGQSHRRHRFSCCSKCR